MKIILINWKGGKKDSFQYFSIFVSESWKCENITSAVSSVETFEK